jgi:hypothetical protein
MSEFLDIEDEAEEEDTESTFQGLVAPKDWTAPFTEMVMGFRPSDVVILGSQSEPQRDLFLTISDHVDLQDLAFVIGPRSEIPYQPLPQIEAEIARAAASILQLGNDWDGEGAIQPSEETFRRASALARDLAAQIVVEFNGPVLVPTIGPNHDGSVDVYWSTPSVTLLINIPNSSEQPTTFSGRRGTETVAGRVALDERRLGHLAAWLACTR